jgi:short-subunit dehydrogenase
VARVGYEGARRGRRVVVPGIVNRLLAQALRLAPRRLANAIAARANRPG